MGRFRTTLFVVWASFFCLGVGAGAAPVDEAARDVAYTLFAKGDFREAADLARQVGDAPSLAFAARCLLAEVIAAPLGEASVKQVKEAEKVARAALVLDPDNIEANVQMAGALGLRARKMGGFAAHIRGFGKKAKIYIDAAFALAPRDPWVLSTKGAWHLEIVRRAGARPASWLYDASREIGLTSFEDALKIDPENISIRHQFALMLLSFDDPALYVRAGEVLSAAQTLEPAIRIEEIALTRIHALLSAYQSGDAKKLAKLVKRQRDII